MAQEKYIGTEDFHTKAVLLMIKLMEMDNFSKILNSFTEESSIMEKLKVRDVFPKVKK